VFIRKLTDAPAFVAVDLPDVPGHGVVRLAPKILQGGAKDLARSVTYSLACLERRETGLSAGISVDGDGRDAAVAAFASEVAGWDAGYSLRAGKGVADAEVATLSGGPDDGLLAGAVAAAVAACPDAATAVTDGGDAEALAGLLAPHGVALVEGDPFTVPADLLFVGSRPGAVDHTVADGLGVRVVVPTARLAVTTKALAHARRRDVVVLPDFVTTAAPLVRDGDAAATIGALTSGSLKHPNGAVFGACERAEAFLATWLDELPFGRPI